MKKALFLAICSFLLFAACTTDEEPDLFLNETTVSPNGGPLILVHYMPWYRGPSVISQEKDPSSYGGHWTRWGGFNPATASDGKARIFAKQYPLTGPYHSGNMALLEYQAALMKIAGIDGVIFDWYGSYNANDFGENHEYTTAMAAVLKRANLKFAACYEDNTLNMIKNLNPAPVTDETLSIGRISFDWAQANWFRTQPYVRYEGSPVLLCFGPQHFINKTQWETVFSGVKPAPWFIDLDNKYAWADSSYNWPPMWASVGGVLTQARLTQYLDDFYGGKQKNKPYRAASVFSAFDDAYETSLGHLDYDNGAVFDLTWKKAIAFDPQIIQIVTWNDYGEGTIIEPTMERGYRELEYLQSRVREYNSEFPFTAEDLRWPLEFYRLRYTQTASSAQESAIKAAINALFEGNIAVFRSEAASTGVAVDINDLKPMLRN